MQLANTVPLIPPQLLYSTKQAAALIGYTARFLEARRVRGDGPKFVRISKNGVRYRIEDLQEWIALRVKTSTSEA
jgi:predicted DNA-binding transcriptional regulator AlpA